MSQHKVFSDLNDRIESAMSVRHLERESRQIAHFINKHGERFHYDAQKKRFLSTAFIRPFRERHGRVLFWAARKL